MSIKLLIVDDHALMRHALCRAFSGTNVEVVAEAGTAADALELALDQPVDAVVLDLHLPDGPSLGVLERIKSVKPSLMVFMHSSDGSPLWIERCRRAGADDYFIKGYDNRRLLAALRALSDRHNTTAAQGEPAAARKATHDYQIQSSR